MRSRRAVPASARFILEAVFPLNIPNLLTLLRILAVPVIVVALLDETPNGDTLAAAVFALAAMTDGLTATSPAPAGRSRPSGS